ncbi:MAG: Coenzyme F420 hydrogenase/dehydrogenase, beta subunit C-terminal domain [Clostridia bacterium]|nr:Coenzyme F420 hydrogenase/dehydrogenase, beta subunit C-terminal domain [Clostridia bacterium]
MVTEQKENLCTGCGVCAVICPQKCISIDLDENGFYKASCNEATCIRCNLCDKICPKFMDEIDSERIRVLSAVSNDAETLRTTSSGGLCYELAKMALSDGKKVCACVYNYKNHRAEHSVITDVEELENTKGSKYFQSYTPEAFSELLGGDEWVVFGSPCQIAAIDAVARLKKCRDKLLLIDFFCHGTPSMNLWKKYIQEQGRERIEKIDFRSKEFGWHTFSLKFTYKDGDTRSDFIGNMFYTFFFGNLCLSEACYSCNFKSLKSKADIRVGDFWGDKYKDDRKGVSCCVTFTEKGDKEMCRIESACRICEEQAEKVLEPQMHKSPLFPPQRKRVLRSFKTKRSLKTIFNTTLFPYRVKCKIKSIMRKDL